MSVAVIGDVQFTATIPASSALANRIALSIFLVYTDEYSPNSLSFALVITSSSVLNVLMFTTGPKISSFITTASSGVCRNTVGGTKYPFELVSERSATSFVPPMAS